MRTEQIAVSTQIFGAQELSDRHLEMIRNAGFQTVEVFAAPEHFTWDDELVVTRIARTMRALGLSVCSVHAPWAPGQDIAALDAGQRERSLRAVERTIDALQVLGGNLLVLHPGATPSNPEMKVEQLRLAEQSIAHIAQYCRDRGVCVALENPPPYELGGNNADILRLYDHFAPNPSVQACFDTGHAHISLEGIGFVQQVPKDLLLVHLSDNAGQTDDHLPPPAGTIPWPKFFDLLRKRHFDGYLVLELTDLPDPENILVSVRHWMTHVLEEIA